MDLKLDSLNALFENKHVATVISLLLALYAGGVAPKLPDSVVLFFDSIVGKLLFTFLIAYVASRNLQIAIMMSVAFVVTLTIANNRRIVEGYNNVEKFYEDDEEDEEDEEDNEDNCEKQLDQCKTELNKLQTPQPNDNLNNFAEPDAETINNSSVTESTDSDESDNIEEFMPAYNLNGDSTKYYAPY